MPKDFQHEDPENWKCGIFYVNKKDHKLIVPKRNPIMGWTFNFAYPTGYIVLAVVSSLVIYTLFQ